MTYHVVSFGFLVFGDKIYHADAPVSRNAVQSMDKEEEKYEVVLAFMA